MPTISVDGLKVIYSNSTAAANITIFGSENDLSSTSNSDWFDVLSLSGGGTGITIYSIDDGQVNDLALQSQLNSSFTDYNSDLLRNDSASCVWLSDYSKLGARIWIGSDNKIHYDASASTSIQALAAGQVGMDTFDYAIRMSNGTLAVGHITVNITGSNDAATISVTPGGDNNVVEAGAAGAGDPSASGDLNISDVDDGEAVFQNPALLAGTYGTFTFDAATGGWTYTLDNSDADTQKLNAGDAVTDSLTVKSFDGTASETITVNITGANDQVTASLPSTFSGSGDPNDNDNATGTATIAGLTGDSGNNTLVGTTGGETLDGKGGNDVIYAGDGNDIVNGSSGDDILYGQKGTDNIDGDSGSDTIYGGSGNDIIVGGSDVDTIYGGSGNDTINASSGADTVIGGYGADNIDLGNDGQSDTLKYLSLNDTNDTVSNFHSGEDKIDLLVIDANPGVGGDQAFAWADDLGGQFVQAHAVSWHSTGGNVDVYADTDGNLATAEFHITLLGITNVAQADFAL